MLFDTVAMLESPVQIVIVLVIALVVFGPNRLPEIGKQIGSALRELRKATNDVVKSLNVEDEPEPYSYPAPETFSKSSDTAQSASAALEPDLTDYTIVGLPHKDVKTGSDGPSEPGEAARIATSVTSDTEGNDEPAGEQPGTPVVSPAVGAVPRTETSAVGAATVKEGEHHV